jgi:hypothetical protein
MAAKEIAADKPSSQSASNVEQRSPLRRTVLFAVAFALLAMVFVPMPMYDHGHHVGGGYRFIFDQSNTGVALFQLLVNVAFAAGVGAIVAQLAKRVLVVIAACIVLAVGAVGEVAFVKYSWERAESDERQALASNPFISAINTQGHWNNAATNWRFAWQFNRASLAAKRAHELNALKLKEQSTTEVESQVVVPTNSPSAVQRYPWRTNIVTTVFWIGEKEHQRSVWDSQWVQTYGGVDSPELSKRRSYVPVAFAPKQNPFYCALPYNDLIYDQNYLYSVRFKTEAPSVIPWFNRTYPEPGQSMCQHHWIAIRKGNRTCYAQWEDVGPFRADHFQYVFGNERPTTNAAHGAGLSVSPDVRDYLGLQPTDVTDWQFVEVADVPPGPWRSYGANNPFVIAREELERLQGKNYISTDPNAGLNKQTQRGQAAAPVIDLSGLPDQPAANNSSTSPIPDWAKDPSPKPTPH